MAEVILEKLVRGFETLIRMNYDDPHRKSISGLAVPYNKVSDVTVPENPLVKERISIGAFKRSVANDNVHLLWQHNDLYVLGSKRGGTLILTEDDEGVKFVNYPPDTDWYKNLEISIKRNDISYMSFKFGAKVHFERTGDGSYLQVVDEGRLNEISVVRDPVYLSTNVYARSADGILLVNNTPVEVVDPSDNNPNPRFKFKTDDELWKRFEEIKNKY